MGLDQIATISISTTSPAVTQAGFGVPLILSYSAAWPSERTRSYSSLSALSSDFAANTVEYLAAAKIFGQSPAPTTVKVGKGTLKPTLAYKVTVRTVANSTDYKIRARVGSTAVDETASFTSDASATNEEIIDGLVAALNLVTSKNYTAAKVGVGAGAYMTVTGTAAGDWFGLETIDTGLLDILINHSDPGVATDLAAIKVYDNDWYGLITLYNSYALVLAAAGWAETATKIYIAATPDYLAKQQTYDGATTTDIASKVKAASYARTQVFYHPAPDDFADAAEFGRFAPLAPGSETWRLKTLSGVTAKTFTDTQITYLEGKNAAYYYTLGGINVVGGKAMVGYGEYVDVVRFRDWWQARTQERLANLLIGANKVPFTDAGIAQVEAEIRAQNSEGIAAGGIANDPAPTVIVPKASSVSAANKSARLLTPIFTTWTLAGAIHKIAVTATVSV